MRLSRLGCLGLLLSVAAPCAEAQLSRDPLKGDIRLSDPTRPDASDLMDWASPGQQSDSSAAAALARSFSGQYYVEDQPLQDLPVLTALAPQASDAPKPDPAATFGVVGTAAKSLLPCGMQPYVVSSASSYWTSMANGVGARPWEPATESSWGSSTFDRSTQTPTTVPQEQWCGSAPEPPWSTEPFPIVIWGPVLVVIIGSIMFWSVRGFRRP